MKTRITREKWRTYKIRPAALQGSIRTLLAAVESGVYRNIVNAWDGLRYVIAPNPGGTPEIIERSNLSEAVKDAMEKVLTIGMRGPYELKIRRREVLALLRQAAKPFRPTPRQKTILLLLNEKPKKLISIAKSLGVQGPTASTYLQPLIEAGLVEHDREIGFYRPPDLALTER